MGVTKTRQQVIKKYIDNLMFHNEESGFEIHLSSAWVYLDLQ